MMNVFSSRVPFLAAALTALVSLTASAGQAPVQPKQQPAPAAAKPAAKPAPKAGNPAIAQSIPPRGPNVREGDWVLYRNDEGLRLETAVSVEQDEGSGDLLITYTMQNVAPNGKVAPAGEGDSLVRMGSQERTELANLAGQLQNPKLDRRNYNIDGKKVNCFVLADVREGFAMEYWYTDDFGIDGQVMSQVVIEGHEEQPAETEVLFEAVAFGNAKSPFNPKNIRKYVK